MRAHEFEPEAGAIVIRRDGGVPRVLLVTAKKQPGEWIFPKGHIEPGEDGLDAALREALEESGVVAVPHAGTNRSVGRTTFEYEGREIAVDYYLLDFVSEKDGSEGRKKEWLEFDDAMRRLTFESTQKLLARARELLRP